VKKGMKHKKRKIERKKHEEKNFEVLTEVKKLWEISRKKDKKIKKEDRQETIEKLLELCKGKMLEVNLARSFLFFLSKVNKYDDSYRLRTPSYTAKLWMRGKLLLIFTFLVFFLSIFRFPS